MNKMRNYLLYNISIVVVNKFFSNVFERSLLHAFI